MINRSVDQGRVRSIPQAVSQIIFEPLVGQCVTRVIY